MEEVSSSSAVAGVLRGAMRPVQVLFRQQFVGKLPVRSVAKVSDATSTLFDVSEHLPKNRKEFFKEMRTHPRKAFGKLMMSFRNVASNAFLGAAVFECYDVFLPQPHRDVGMHVVAGSVAGLVHSCGTSIIVNVQNVYHHGSLVMPRFGPIIHHVIAHGTLFGTFEVLKRGFKYEEDYFLNSKDAESETVGVVDIATVGFAGGIAGQVQYVVSHYTEVLETENASFRMSYSFLVNNLKLRPPTLRSLFLAFPPSAIAFVAFDYSKDLIET